MKRFGVACVIAGIALMLAIFTPSRLTIEAEVESVVRTTNGYILQCVDKETGESVRAESPTFVEPGTIIPIG